jgi:hypothetical protein
LKYPEYYFSRFYFTEEEIEELLNFPTTNGLVCKDIIDIKKIENKNGEICTSHDIAPFMYKIF